MIAFLRLKASNRIRSRLNHYYTTKACDPLRILFCGSEEYSIASLRALREEQLRRQEDIASIDVVCRPGKRIGRGLKEIRDVPIKAVAQRLALPVHEIDTFTGWTPPKPAGELINLVIAVSFGLLVPPRILKAAKYGGLNLHPSLLPDFRGPAPLHHTLLAGETKTGVTLQTLHPSRFDHGTILDQTPSPGFDIPNPTICTVEELRDLVAAKSAQMLLDSIRNRRFVCPVEDVGTQKNAGTSAKLRHASKITPEDRHIKWGGWGTEEIIRRNRVLGPLWNMSHTDEGPRRLIFPNLQKGAPFVGTDRNLDVPPGYPYYLSRDVSPGLGPVLVNTVDHNVVELPQIKAEGEPLKPAIDVVRHPRFSRHKLKDEPSQGITWHVWHHMLT